MGGEEEDEEEEEVEEEEVEEEEEEDKKMLDNLISIHFILHLQQRAFSKLFETNNRYNS